MIEKNPQLVENFLTILRNHTAGDPMRHDVKWTNLSRRQIARKLSELGTPANKNIVSRHFMIMITDDASRKKSEQWGNMLIATTSLKILPNILTKMELSRHTLYRLKSGSYSGTIPKMLSVNRPMLVVVLNCWVTATKDT